MIIDGMIAKKALRRVFAYAKKTRSIAKSSEECVIFGSGPSLDNLNSTANFLNGKDLIGCNFVHQHIALKEKRFKIITMIDRDYTKQLNDEYFKELTSDYFFVSTKNVELLALKHLVRKSVGVISTKKFTTREEIDREDIFLGNRLCTGNSLPFLIQLAAFVAGYKKIFLFGVDHFDIDDLDEKENQNYEGYQGRELKSLRLSPKKLNYINSLYDFVGDLCRFKGVTVINLTPDTKLTTFDSLILPNLSSIQHGN